MSFKLYVIIEELDKVLEEIQKEQIAPWEAVYPEVKGFKAGLEYAKDLIHRKAVE